MKVFLSMKSDLRIQNRDFHSALCEEQFFLVNNKKNSSLTSHSIIHKYLYVQKSEGSQTNIWSGYSESLCSLLPVANTLDFHYFFLIGLVQSSHPI